MIGFGGPARQAWPLVTVEGLVLVALVALVDYLTGWEVAFHLFYLIPVAGVILWAGKWPGVVVAAVSALTGFIVEQGKNRPPYQHPISPYVNLVLQTVFLFTFAFLLDSLKRALDREKQLSNQDPVTGLGNRRAFYQRTGFEMDRAQRYQHRFTVAYIDLDDFKQVNDRHGHHQGDRLLRLVADTLRTSVRKTDFVARLGGDEFALLLPETSDSSAQLAIHKVQAKLLEAMAKSGYPVTFSIGAVTFARPPETIDEVIAQADDLMYAVKQEGKNGVRHKAAG